MRFDLRPHTHLLAVGGSRAYGLHHADSDVDLKGVAIPPLQVQLGFLKGFEQADQAGDLDVFADLVPYPGPIEGSVYGLTKFARLAVDANPHMFDLLFCRDQEVLLSTPIGEALREAGPRFLSRRARHSFGGYAAAQLKRIETHRRWLRDPPETQPTRAEHDLPEVTVIAKDQLVAAAAAVRKQVDSWELDLSGVPKSTAIDIQNRVAQVLAEIGVGEDERWRAAAHHVGLSEDFIQHMFKERRYKRAMQQFRQYQHWKAHRNPARAALEAKHGYDTKHGSHLVRLLTMALEIVETMQVHVWRGDRDAELLKAIKAGAWDHDQLLQFVQDTVTKLDAALPTSPLPKRPDVDALNRQIVAWCRG